MMLSTGTLEDVLDKDSLVFSTTPLRVRHEPYLVTLLISLAAEAEVFLEFRFQAGKAPWLSLVEVGSGSTHHCLSANDDEVSE